MKVFKLAVRTGLFKNCPIEEKDVANAEKIYGPSTSAIKGKTKRPTPDTVIDDWVEIPRDLTMHNEHLDVCLEAVNDGTIDVISSGHQPRSLEKKMQELDAAPFGMTSLDTTLSQLVTSLVKPGRLSWSQQVSPSAVCAHLQSMHVNHA